MGGCRKQRLVLSGCLRELQHRETNLLPKTQLLIMTSLVEDPPQSSFQGEDVSFQSILKETFSVISQGYVAVQFERSPYYSFMMRGVLLLHGLTL